MQVHVDIEFEQLVEMAKQLPPTQWRKLKTEVEKSEKEINTISELEDFLLNSSNLNKKQFMKFLT